MDRFFVRSVMKCDKKGCDKKAVLLDRLSGRRFCLDCSPKVWVEEAQRNESRINHIEVARFFHHPLPQG